MVSTAPSITKNPSCIVYGLPSGPHVASSYSSPLCVDGPQLCSSSCACVETWASSASTSATQASVAMSVAVFIDDSGEEGLHNRRLRQAFDTLFVFTTDKLFYTPCVHFEACLMHGRHPASACAAFGARCCLPFFHLGSAVRGRERFNSAGPPLLATFSRSGMPAVHEACRPCTMPSVVRPCAPPLPRAVGGKSKSPRFLLPLRFPFSSSPPPSP